MNPTYIGKSRNQLKKSNWAILVGNIVGSLLLLALCYIIFILVFCL